MTGRLEQINAKIVEAVQKDHKEELLPLNYEFHFTIYKAAHLEVLLPMTESLWLQAGPFTYYSTPSPRALWDVRHHCDLITALQRRDEHAAGEALSQDILTASQFLKRSGHFAKPRMRQPSATDKRRFGRSVRNRFDTLFVASTRGESRVDILRDHDLRFSLRSQNFITFAQPFASSSGEGT